MEPNSNKKLRAQGVVEYMLVFVCAAVLVYAFASQFDLKRLKTFAVFGVQNGTNSSTIIIPPMTK